MAGVPITSGTGTTMAADNVGSASAPTTNERIPYMKLDGGIAGASVPIEAGNAAALAAQVTTKSVLATRPGQWVATHAPAANTQASASKAAGGSGVRHLCQALVVTLANGASAPTAALVTVNLRDGATGAGSVLATFTLAVEAVAGKVVTLPLTGLSIVGSANTAMTLETGAAPGANVSASVTLIGCTTPSA